MRRFTETINEHTKYPNIVPVKGLVLVHLFNKVWRIGGIKIIDGKRHSVIYSPEDKEYHVWEKDVLSFYSNPDDPDGHFFNKPDPAKVKIYILTHILDQKENWSFDMSKTPEVGSNVKVIFENGKIQWEKFEGKWEDLYEKDWHWHLGFGGKSGAEVVKRVDENGKPTGYYTYKKIVAWRVK